MTRTQTIAYRLQKLLIRAFASLPLRMLYGVSDFAAFLLNHVAGYRRKVIASNLRLAFPDASEKRLRHWRNSFYRHFCDVFIEAAKLANISDQEVFRRVKFEGLQKVNESLRKGKSVILMLGHFGNWEWVTSAAPHFLPGVISCEIYHPLSDPVFDKIMLHLRSRFHTENIPMAHTMRRLLQINSEGRQFVCGFISDQRPFSDRPKHWTTFMGVDTAYINGGEVIGRKIGADFFYVEMMPLKRGHYRLSFKKLEGHDDGAENPLTREYLLELEKSIRKNPPAWLWSHKRWSQHRTDNEIQD